MRDFDLLVVGGGPGGSAAAIAAARGGLRVGVIERKRMPRYKTCGGGLLPRGVRVLERLGMGGALDRSGEAVVERAFCGVELNFLESGWSFGVEREWPVVRMVMRAGFDQMLLAEAERLGCCVMESERVVGMEQDSEGVTVRAVCEAGGAERTYRARFLVGADGAGSDKASGVARLAGFGGVPWNVPALEWEMWVDEQSWERFSGVVRFDFEVVPEGYGWVFPKGKHLSVGVGGVAGAEGLTAACAAYVQRLGIVATRVEKHGWVIPCGMRADGVTRNRVLLVGDAAGLADPITLEGISPALLSGELAGRAVAASGGNPFAARKAYERSLEKELLCELRMARRMSRLFYKCPRIRASLFRRQGQRMTERFLDLIAGEITWEEILSRSSTWRKLLNIG